MQVRNQKEFEETKNRHQVDPYDKLKFDFLECWADRMEARLKAGETLADIAEATRAEAYAAVGGVNGYLIGSATTELIKHWVHGDELRQWNLVNLQPRVDEETSDESADVFYPSS
jgi:hypothetical protein